MQEVSGSSPLSSTGQKRNSKDSNSGYSRKVAGTAGKYSNGGQLAAVCVFGSGIFSRLGLLAGHRIPGAEAALVSLSPGKSPPRRSRDSRHLVTTRLPGGPCPSVAVAAFASGPATLGVLARPMCSQEPHLLTRAARSLTAGSARARTARRWVSGRRWACWCCDAQARGCAATRSRRGATQPADEVRARRIAGAPSSPPGVPRWGCRLHHR